MQELYIFSSSVIKGKNRGKTLGFPTANMKLQSPIPEGIYTAIVEFDGKQFQSAVFVGAAETFGEKDVKAEVYILDFDENIYAKNLTVKIYKKLRDNKRFATKKELIEQMEKDILATREFFS